MSPMLDIQRRHAEVFRLRLGDKNKGGYPQKLTDAIRVTSPNRSVVDAFVAVYGGETQPWAADDGQQWQAYLPTTEIPIMVLPGQSISQWWELYRKSVCERRCDGFTESLSGRACMCPSDLTERMAATGACRPMTRINVVCPDVAVVGAGALVSHGMVAAETLPQSIKIAEAALARGLMVPAVLRVVEHKGKRHYVVPQVEIVGLTLAALETGESPTPIAAPARAAIGSGGGAAPNPVTTLAPSAASPRALPPLPGELAPPAAQTVPCPDESCTLRFASKAAAADHVRAAHGWVLIDGKVHPPSAPGSTEAGPPATDDDVRTTSAGSGVPTGGGAVVPTTASPPSGASPKQLGMMHAILSELGVPDDDRHRYVGALVGVDGLTSMGDLSKRQVSAAIDALKAEQAG